MIKVPGGLLTNVVQALDGTFSGKKSVPLAVQFVRAKKTVAEYEQAWRSEQLAPAIREFTDGGDSVEPEQSAAFFEKYPHIFNDEVEVDIDPISLDELSDLNVEDDNAFGLLFSFGVIVDSTSE